MATSFRIRPTTFGPSRVASSFLTWMILHAKWRRASARSVHSKTVPNAPCPRSRPGVYFV